MIEGRQWLIVVNVLVPEEEDEGGVVDDVGDDLDEEYDIGLR